MKMKDIVIEYGVNKEKFESFIKQSGIQYNNGMMGGMVIDDSKDINNIVLMYKKYEEEEAQKSESLAKAESEKIKALSQIMITSGFTFDGYTITKYSGYISGDDAVQIDRGTVGFFGAATNVGENLMASLVVIRRKAIAELKEAAYELGCNAVIGVDFDYLTLDPVTASSAGGTVYLPYVFGVTANGNAVIIEKK